MLMEEPKNINELALAKWKKLKSSKFVMKIIIEKIKIQDGQPLE